QYLYRATIAIYYFSFFFYSYADPRDLHSFPTRRSSDLGLISLPEAAQLGCRACASPGCGCQFLGTAATSQVVGEALGMSLPHTADRKSTRLNSSHVKISYAVFCLKKKKKKHKNMKYELR